MLVFPSFLRFARSRGRRLRRLGLLLLGLGLPVSGMAHGALDARIAELREMLAAAPDDAALRFGLAQALCEHGEWNLALEEAAWVERASPGRFPTALVRGEALLGHREPAAAKRALDRLLEQHPRHVRALTLRARARATLGEADESLADYRAALDGTLRTEPELVQEVAGAFARRGQPEEALAVLDRGIAQLGDIPSLVAQALELEEQTRRFDAALAHAALLQQAAPRPEPWMARRAAILAQAGRIAEARDAWQALLDHLATLPNLDRGTPALVRLASDARAALRGLAAGRAAPASASPALPVTTSARLSAPSSP